MKLRFTNRAVKALFDKHGIDLLKLDGTALMDAETRLKITEAGFVSSGEEPLVHDEQANIPSLCDDLTPGDHIDLLNAAIIRDLLPASAREAVAKAAAASKSEAPAA